MSDPRVMSPGYRAAITGREAKATPGPWEAVRDPAISSERALIVQTSDPQLMIHVLGSWIPYTPERKGALNLDAFGVLHGNAVFIAAARSDIPALLNNIAYLTERLAATERLLLSVLTDVDDDFDGFSSVRMDIAKFLGKDPAPWL